ncbi:MAG: hypothetical protein JJ992_05590, partial [Planctomycetes bacterium]|nr:hypothetical protein [Planctomycetota bacterium]
MSDLDRDHADEQLGLDDFLTPPEDQGLSLDELTKAYADLLGRGEDPYTELRDDESPVDPD